MNPVDRSILTQYAAIVAVVLLAFTACRSSDGSERANGGVQGSTVPSLVDSAPVDGGLLVVAVPHETSGWNPTYDRWDVVGSVVGSTMLETLAFVDAEGTVQPWLATSWQHNGDFTRWTIHVRPGVQFHDGATLDAEAVRANIQAQITGVLTGFAYKDLVDHAEVVDPSTVDVVLHRPWSDFPALALAGSGAAMRSPSTLAREDGGSSFPVGTGPFTFKEWERDRKLVVERNPNYWRPGEPHLDSIEFRPVVDDIARSAGMRAGDYDVMLTTSARDAVELGDTFAVIKDWDHNPSSVVINTRPTLGAAENPLANLHARRALALATDRHAVARHIGDGVPTYPSPFPPDGPWGQPDEATGYPAYDPDAARREIAAYAGDTGRSTIDITLLGRSDTESQATLQLIQGQWAAVGIETTIRAVDSLTLEQSLLGSVYNVALVPLYVSTDPDLNYLFWSKDNIGEYGRVSINMSGFANDITEGLLDRARRTNDYATRRQIYNELIQELNRNVTTIWLNATPFSLVASRRVGGLRRASEVPFANIDGKTWWGEVWNGR